MRLRICLVAAAVLMAAPAVAQTPYPPIRDPFLTVTFGSASRSQDTHQQGHFSHYQEDAAFDLLHSPDRASFFDIGGGIRVWRGMFVGITYTARRKETFSGPVEAFVPHPVFYDSFRTAAGTISGLEHSEHAVHIQGIWRFELAPAFQVDLFGGPSLFNATHVLLESFAVEEVDSSFAQVNIGQPTLREDSEAVFGGHAGVDAMFRIVRHVGVGAMVRYSRAVASFDLQGARNSEILVGGLDAGVRVRLGF